MPDLLEQSYQLASSRPWHEERDIHEADEALAVAVNALRGDFHPDWKLAARAHLNATVPNGGTVYADIEGMGRVYDWRDSPWTPVNGGRIDPNAMVQHIPVVRNVDGIGDFITLRNVLVGQGLMVQRSTDAEGNVALFTPNNSLCYQARGLNQQSCGCEHMHFSLTEAWTKRQLRAVAWVIWQAKHTDGIEIPIGKGRLASGGSGVARIVEPGQVTHKDEADKAGYHDRSDPGDLLWVEHWDEVQHNVHYYDAHKSFVGA
jgi:hypothetical protein